MWGKVKKPSKESKVLFLPVDVGFGFIFRLLMSLGPAGDYYSVDAPFGTRTTVCIIYARPSSILKNGPLFLYRAFN